MVSPTDISYELNRCANLRYNLIILFLDATIYGYANRIYRSVKDIMTLYALEKALYNAVYYDLDDTAIYDLMYKIREFLSILNYTSQVDYLINKYPTLNCSTDIDGIYTTPVNPTSEPTMPTNTNNNTKWNTTDLSSKITVNGQTTIEDIGFDISTIDIDTVLLQVQGDDSYYTTTGEGYHIIGSTLYWHSFYDLQVGMNIVIKWRTE